VKLVGGDNGRVEREEFVENIAITPSERVVVEAVWEEAGRIPIEHRNMAKKIYTLGTVIVTGETAEPSYMAEFSKLRRDPQLEALRQKIANDFEREPDKTISLTCERLGMRQDDESMHGHMMGTMQHHNMSPSNDFSWKIIDQAAGKANHDIDWAFECGKLVKIRIENPSDSELPMPHPMHFHGQRFLVLRRNGSINDNLVWKDTVLVGMGDVVDILLDTSNPGTWMAHCHIAEHVEDGMMFNFLVKD
jgi:FtsP/CotA-like multicopper oxidase with cupredoxin domain